MVSLTAVALGISFLTTSFLTFHDTVKQFEHAKGFATFLLTQDIHTNAQYAMTCVTTAIEERITTRGEEIKKNLHKASSDFVNQTFSVLQCELDKKLKLLSINSLINLVREQEKKINEDQTVDSKQVISKEIAIDNKATQIQKSSTQQQKPYQSMGLWDRLTRLRDSISKQVSKELQCYHSIRRGKQKEALYYLYDIYKQKKGIKCSKWITPYNIIMMILLGIGSFFFPKLAICLAASYFLSCEVYLLSDTLAAATKSEVFKNLNFDRVFQFHMVFLTAGFGYYRYNLYRGNTGSPGSSNLKNKGQSVSY